MHLRGTHNVRQCACSHVVFPYAMRKAIGMPGSQGATFLRFVDIGSLQESMVGLGEAMRIPPPAAPAASGHVDRNSWLCGERCRGGNSVLPRRHGATSA